LNKKLNYLSAPTSCFRKKAVGAQAGKTQIPIIETNRFEFRLFEFGVCLLFACLPADRALARPANPFASPTIILAGTGNL
jgi:hypothetical protein